MKYPDGSVYEGDFHKGHRHGQGLYTYANGDTYEGEWYKGKKHGRGVYISKGGSSTVFYLLLIHLFTYILIFLF